MSTLYRCPTCQSETTSDEMTPPRCVRCEVDMAPVGSADADETDDAADPIAPVNLGAYQDGLAAIEKAKAKADADEREYVRAKEYAAKAKKRLETSEADLRTVIGDVADRLRPRPLFEHPDTHTDEELVALLKSLNVDVTLEKVQGWTDAERADARAWALAAHSEQPRLIPPFLWAPAGESDDDDQGEASVAYAQKRLDDLASRTTRCPYCNHSENVHSAPSPDGLADDGGPLDPDYVAGRCHQSDSAGECDCPGWHPDLPATFPPGCDADGHHYPEKKARKSRKRVSEEVES